MTKPLKPFKGETEVPGDKSLLHRAILFNAIAEGEALLVAKTIGRDNLASLRAVQTLGAKVELSVPEHMLSIAKAEGIARIVTCSDQQVSIKIEGLGGRQQPELPESLVIDCGNSGTTARLLAGILAGRPVKLTLDGDESLRKRPFARVTSPLSRMGARFSGDNLPLVVEGASPLSGIEWSSPQSSAQVKSAILLAGLSAAGTVEVSEQYMSRDHTERMFEAMGCELVTGKRGDGHYFVRMDSPIGKRTLRATDFEVPGDFSSASFLIAMATMVPDSEVIVRKVGINPSRTGLLSIIAKMGANIEVKNEKSQAGESQASIVVQHSFLEGVSVDGEDVLRAIDEIPLVILLGAFASGQTIIRGAGELRVKESDRLKMMALLLKCFGVEVQEFDDGVMVTGRPELAGSGQSLNADMAWQECLDHRIHMCASLARYILNGEMSLTGQDAVETSFPGFLETFRELQV